MPLWEKFAWAVVAVEVAFGAAEIFFPSWVFGRVLPNYDLPNYHDASADLVWIEAEKITRNIGLYNWFLALGLLLSLSEWPHGATTSPFFSQFFLGCVAAAGIFGLFTVSRSLPFPFSSLLFALPFILQLGLGLLTLMLFLVG